MARKIDEQKQQAAVSAVNELRPGMTVGLGSGTTAEVAVQVLGRRLQTGRLRDITGVPTSHKTAALARSYDIPLRDLGRGASIDITIDGADEIDPQLNLIKGLGGAFLIEKVVAASTERLIIVADGRKLSPRLGSRAPVPVEVVPFARYPVEEYLRGLGARPKLRMKADQPYLTDEGNFVLDCGFEVIEDPFALAAAIRARPGVVEHGLFLGMASDVFVVVDEMLQHLTAGGD